MRKLFVILVMTVLLLMVACTVPAQQPSGQSPSPQVAPKEPAPIMPPALPTIPNDLAIQPLDLSDTMNESIDDMQYYVKVT